EDEGLSPMPVGIDFAQESNAWLFAPREASIALLGARDFDSGRSERRFLQHDLIARRDLHIPVAAIERFRPDERGRFRWTPGKVPRTHRNTSDGNAVCRRKRGDGMSSNVGTV